MNGSADVWSDLRMVERWYVLMAVQLNIRSCVMLDVLLGVLQGVCLVYLCFYIPIS